MANFTVVYDACVLYPASIRDLAVELARTGLVNPPRTAAEMIDSYERNGLAISASVLRGRIESL